MAGVKRVINRPEHDLQAAIVHWARLHEKWYPELKALYAIGNGGFRFRTTAKLLSEEGVKSGVPDLCLPVPRGGYGALYIELKAKNGRVSDSQRSWLNMLTRLGNLCMVGKSYESVISTILKYLRGDILKKI